LTSISATAAAAGGAAAAAAADSSCTIIGQRIVCRLGTLPSDAVRTISFGARALSAGNYINTATVTAAGDAVASNNEDQAAVVVTVSTELHFSNC
jgi:hypothetical protein